MSDKKLEYTTYVMGKEDFANADISDIQFKVEMDRDMAVYTIKTSMCGLDTPVRRVLELLLAGMDFTITFPNKKYKLELKEIESKK